MSDVRFGDNARKGDILICHNGHQICDVSEDALIGSHVNTWHTILINWRQPEPKIGDPLPVCAECGGPIFDLRH